MFTTDKHEAKISNVNLRAEKHGAERKLGVDISIKLVAGNETLDGIEKGLRETLFRKAGSEEQMDLVAGAEALVAVRHPCIGAIPITGDFPGYALTMEGMLEGTDPIVLVDVKLKKFVVEALEGGSASISLQAQAQVDSEELAEIADALIRETVLLTLTPPAAQTQQDNSLPWEDEESAETPAVVH